MDGGVRRGLLLSIRESLRFFRHALKSESYLPTLQSSFVLPDCVAAKMQPGSRLQNAPDSLAEWSKALASGASP